MKKAKKKLLSIIALFAMCFALAGCGDNASSEDTNKDTETATTSATENTTNTEPTAAPEPVDEGIEITTDNWQDYFDIVYVPDISYEEDNVTIDDVRMDTYLVLKEGYSIPENDENILKFFFDATFEWRLLLLDTTTLEVTIGEINPLHDPDPNQVLDCRVFSDGYSSPLLSIYTTGPGYIDNTGDNNFANLYAYTDQGTNKKIPSQMLPMGLVCTEVSGKIYPVK